MRKKHAFLLHGWAHSPVSMQPLAEQLPADWKISVPDLNGSPEQVTAALHELFLSAADDDDLVIIGWSLGWLYGIKALSPDLQVHSGFALAALPCFTGLDGISRNTVKRLSAGIQKNRLRTLKRFAGWVDGGVNSVIGSASQQDLLSGLQVLETSDFSDVKLPFPVTYVLATDDAVLPFAASQHFFQLDIVTISGSHGFPVKLPAETARVITGRIQSFKV